MLDKEFVILLIKLIIFLPLILLCIYVVLKYGGGKLQNIQNAKYIKILERVHLSKDNSILAVKIGEKGYIISNTNNNVQIMLEIDKNDLNKLQENNKLQNYNSLRELRKKFKHEEE